MEYFETTTKLMIQKQITGVDAEPGMGGLKPNAVFWRVDTKNPSLAPIVFYHDDLTNTELSSVFETMVISIKNN